MGTDYTRIMTRSTQVTTRYIQGFFQKKGINWWKCPAEIPDLNPIEKVWGTMKIFLRDKPKPKNISKLKEGSIIFGRQ